MKKPTGLTKEQWSKYKKAVNLAVDATSKSLDLIAEANFQAGEINERERIIKLLMTKKVVRIDALGSLVFVNCDTLEVEYLDGLKGDQK